MATEQEKEELMQTLKFTPRNYRVEIWGRGGEVYWGTVDRKIYDFFKSKEIDIEQYAGSWEERMWDDIPFDLQPFSPGSPYEGGHNAHISGATFDESSHIAVYDETGAQIWTSTLGTAVLEENGATSDCIDEHYINDYPDGTVVFWGAQGEKGTFFGNDFELRAPFDPSKLRVVYEDMDGWELTSGVQYDGEDIDGNDYDTTGKWSENKWIIVGGEPPYQGVERDEEAYEDTSDDDEEITLDELEGTLDELGASLGMPMTPEEMEEAYTIDCQHCAWRGPMVNAEFKDGNFFCPQCLKNMADPVDKSGDSNDSMD